MTKAFAPGKAILFGEHAVVYGRPAIAVPVLHVQAVAEIVDMPAGYGVAISAPDLGLQYALREALPDDPHALTIRNTLAYLCHAVEPDIQVTISSTIPVAGGLGSGAAVATALARALAEHLDRQLSPAEVSAIVFETEKLHHGTPSGVDNTVVAYAQPIYFVRGRQPERFAPDSPIPLIIADSGTPSPTKIAVGDVRQGWKQNTDRYETLFDEIAAVVRAARQAIEDSNFVGMGRLMVRNHRLLQSLDVSSDRLDALVDAACRSGAWGAKLSGGGRGGNVIAVAPPTRTAAVCEALRCAGAVAVSRRE